MTEKPSFRRQFIALTKRNILLKKKNLDQILTELLFPLILVFSAIMYVKSNFNLEQVDAIPKPIGTGTNWFNGGIESHITWYLAPNNSFTQTIGTEIKETFKSMRLEDRTPVIEYAEVEALLNYKKDERYRLGIVFDNKTETDIHYILTVPQVILPSKQNQSIGDITKCRDKPFERSVSFTDRSGSNCPQMLYYVKGYSFVQSVIDSAIIRATSPNSSDYVIPNAELFTYPKPSYKTSTNVLALIFSVSICFILLSNVPIITIILVKEKEKRIKEAMFMMGLRPVVYWTVWMTVETAIGSIIVIILSLGLWLIEFIPNITILDIFPLLFLLSITIIELSAILSMFFDKEMTAAQTVQILAMGSILPIGLAYFDWSPIGCFFIALLSPAALALGIKSIYTILFINESTLSPYNMFFGSDFPIGFVLLVLILDIILYGLLAIYLDKIMPGKYGVRHGFCFCFNRKYWFPERPPQLRTKSEPNVDIEKVSEDLKSRGVINIQKMSKQFKNVKTKAVDNISLTIYESQITALLGHNGAGKSTLINMLLGAIEPDSGTAEIYGKNVTNPSEMSELRSMFGVCLQENILFDELDSEEHLNFFGEMKGLTGNTLTNEVNKLLIDVDLYTNRLTPSADLSGGQKRKLCIAIALIASPKVVILDEPTSGVDIAIRRQIWTMIRSYKQNKTIIMTTHFMEEADVMSDRKAIISKGKLRCVGSSLFLKQKFGVGYHLTIDMNNEIVNSGHVPNIQEITNLVSKEIDKSKFEAFIGTEIFYILPQNQSQNFSNLFTQLENRMQTKNDIKSYGLSMTTLEEVFLRLEDEAAADHKSEQNKISIDNIKSEPTFFQSFMAFINVKILIQIRNPINFLSMILIVILLGLILVFMRHFIGKNERQPILIDPNIYGNPVLKCQTKSGKGLEFNQFQTIVNGLGVKTEVINDINLDTLTNSFMSVLIDNFENDSIEWKWFFNESHIFALPILQNLMANTYLRSTTQLNHRISTSLKVVGDDLAETVYLNAMLLVYTIYFLWTILIVFCFNLSMETVDDRETKIIETIRISGMGFWCYWLTNLFVHSLMCYLIEIIFFSFLGLTFEVFIFDSVKMFFIASIHVTLSAVGILLTYYVLTHLIDKKETAAPLIIYVFLITLFSMAVIAIIFLAAPLIISLTCFVVACILWPPLGYLLGLSLMAGSPYTDDITFEMLILAPFLMLGSIIIYLGLLEVVDKLKMGTPLLTALGLKANDESFPYSNYSSPMEDMDAIQEREQVINVWNTNQNFPILLIHGLRKVFFHNKFFFSKSQEPEVAVSNLSLMVTENNIFGLLGPNGAGKTTTMKMIIRQVLPTNGSVLIDGQKSESQYLHKQIGYCPQHDTLFKNITLKEHLIFFAGVRGINKLDIDNICNNFMSILRIKEHEHKYSEQLSGGTKRKLCYILSLMGPSRLVLLDEPSTGMDPHSKRFLWTTIQNTFSNNSSKSAVLTTHSMEEAEALCTRIAIMTKGVMRCIGSAQHLKNKYGAGYILNIQWDQSVTKSDSVKQLISTIFNEWTLIEESEDRLTADVPQKTVPLLSVIFLALEQIKSDQLNGILEYGFSQTTLEQVFIYFAKQQPTNVS